MFPLDENLLWQIRTFIYDYFAATTQPPTVDETADHFQLGSEQAAIYYRELDRRHAIFLEPDTLNILIANPFSAVPTPFQVHAQGKTYWANCAWDALGIPAALGSDATVETTYAEDGLALVMKVSQGQVVSPGTIVHFLVPFHQWYEDMVNT